MTAEGTEDVAARARRLLAALDATGDSSGGTRLDPERWAPYFTIDADPYVVADPERAWSTLVATIDKSPSDYGKARAELIAAAPELLEALVGALEERTRERDEARSTAEHWHHRWCEDQGIYDPLLTPPLPWEDR